MKNEYSNFTVLVFFSRHTVRVKLVYCFPVCVVDVPHKLGVIVARIFPVTSADAAVEFVFLEYICSKFVLESIRHKKCVERSSSTLHWTK